MLTANHTTSILLKTCVVVVFQVLLLKLSD